jgi:hypothetical protein
MDDIRKTYDFNKGEHMKKDNLDYRLLEYNKKLALSPDDAQLTMHFDNLKSFYSNAQIAAGLQSEAHSFILAATISNLNQYYGAKKVRQFWSSIVISSYGKKGA